MQSLIWSVLDHESDYDSNAPPLSEWFSMLADFLFFFLENMLVDFQVNRPTITNYKHGEARSIVTGFEQ